MLEWAWFGSHKKCVGTCYAELVFLHLMQSMSYVVHLCASRLQNVDVLFFMLDWPRCGSLKLQDRTQYAELVLFHPV
jgi:hypothetical protein